MFHTVAGIGDGYRLNAVGRQLILDNRGEGVLNEPFLHLAAGGHDGSCFFHIGEQLQQGRVSGGPLRRPELFLLDNEGNHPHPC